MYCNIYFLRYVALLWAKDFVMDTASDMIVIGNIQQQNNLSSRVHRIPAPLILIQSKNLCVYM
jgi:hypothetical protein